MPRYVFMINGQPHAFDGPDQASTARFARDWASRNTAPRNDPRLQTAAGLARSFGSGLASSVASATDVANPAQALGGAIDDTARLGSWAGMKLGMMTPQQRDQAIAAEQRFRRGTPLETGAEQLQRAGLTYAPRNLPERMANMAGAMLPNAFAPEALPGNMARTLGGGAARVLVPTVGAIGGQEATRAMGAPPFVQQVAGVAGAAMGGRFLGGDPWAQAEAERATQEASDATPTPALAAAPAEPHLHLVPSAAPPAGKLVMLDDDFLARWDHARAGMADLPKDQSARVNDAIDRIIIDPFMEDPPHNGHDLGMVADNRDQLADLSKQMRAEGGSGPRLADTLDGLTQNYFSMVSRQKPDYAQALGLPPPEAQPAEVVNLAARRPPPPPPPDRKPLPDGLEDIWPLIPYERRPDALEDLKRFSTAAAAQRSAEISPGVISLDRWRNPPPDPRDGIEPEDDADFTPAEMRIDYLTQHPERFGIGAGAAPITSNAFTGAGPPGAGAPVPGAPPVSITGAPRYRPPAQPSTAMLFPNAFMLPPAAAAWSSYGSPGQYPQAQPQPQTQSQ